MRLEKTDSACFTGFYIQEESPVKPYEPWFDYADDLVKLVGEVGSVAVYGGPGAGKSHITEDILVSSYHSGKPTLMVACHVNANHPKGREFTDEAIKTAADIGAIVIFDNLDYAVYTGGKFRRRSNTKALEEVRVQESRVSLLCEHGANVMATLHTSEWRRNHSGLPEEEIQRFEQFVKNNFKVQLEFTGELGRPNAKRILLRRGASQAEAQTLVEELDRLSALTFRNTFHIDIGAALSDGAEVAIRRVSELQQQKLIGGA